MGTNLITPPDDLVLGRRNFGFFDDFVEFVSGDLFTDSSADAGASVAGQNNRRGEVLLTTGATAANEVYLHTTLELFQIEADKPLLCEARFQYAEAATDDAIVIFGFVGVAGGPTLPNTIQDGAAGPLADYSGAVFFKVDGDTNWSVESSDGGAGQQTTHELTADNSNDGLAKVAGTAAGTYATHRIEIVPTSSTRVDVAFFIDGILVRKHPNITFANNEPAIVVMGLKAGAGGTSETMLVDYIAAYQLR